MPSYNNLTAMEKFDVIVIGGGFSGLTCGIIMAKEGKKVCVLEKELQLGGAFQSYQRNRQQLETGFHYVGGVGENEIMRPVVEYFGLDKLQWEPLDDEFLKVITEGQSYSIRSGYDAFVDTLSRQFPDQRQGLVDLIELLNLLNRNIYKTVHYGGNASENKLLSVSAKEYLETHFSNPVLRKVLCGQSLTTELTDELPLYSFLQTLNSFLQHSYRLKGGGKALIDHLANQLSDLGGIMLKSHAIKQFVVSDEDNDIKGVICTNGESFEADTYISTIHPALTIDLIPECKQVRNIYRRRIRNIENSIGMFTAHLVLKPDAIPYMKHNISILNSDDLWHTSYGKDASVQNMLINYNTNADESSFATNIDLITPMSWEAVSEWADSTLGHRPEEYKAFKQRKADECISLADKYINGLCDSIERIWTSTPLTYRDYTGTINGSAYGVRKSCKNLLGTILSPNTPFNNLFLSGQNLMLHGMQGVAMTAFLTCNSILKKNILGI